MRVIRLTILAAVLAGCTQAPPQATRQEPASTALPLPPMKAFGSHRVTRPARSNAEIARDFMELAFQMESGRKLANISRFEGPITLRITGKAPTTAGPDVKRLLARLRREAGIPITQVSATTPASITVEFLPRARMQALVPQAACFVVPRVTNWTEFRRARRSSTVDWTTLKTRTRATVFIPQDTAPQEVRDCLHEEIAQALGPLNDLYRLPDSVFNDDNFHTVLTGFDMLILRTFYASELSSGMTPQAVSARLPAVLARINPRGGLRNIARPDPTPRRYVDAIENALGPRSAPTRRRSAARQAVGLSSKAGWRDPRAGFAWFALGRLSLSGDLDTALSAFLAARDIYRSRPGMEVQAAHVEMQLAAFALSAGRADDADRLAARAIPAVRAAENAALLATLMLIRAEALDLKGRTTEAQAVRKDALGWARYGFGPDADVRRRVAEIAALSPSNRIRAR